MDTERLKKTNPEEPCYQDPRQLPGACLAEMVQVVEVLSRESLVVQEVPERNISGLASLAHQPDCLGDDEVKSLRPRRAVQLVAPEISGR